MKKFWFCLGETIILQKHPDGNRAGGMYMY